MDYLAMIKQVRSLRAEYGEMTTEERQSDKGRQVLDKIYSLENDLKRFESDIPRNTREVGYYV